MAVSRLLWVPEGEVTTLSVYCFPYVSHKVLTSPPLRKSCHETNEKLPYIEYIPKLGPRNFFSNCLPTNPSITVFNHYLELPLIS